MDLAIVWFVLVFVLLAGYAVLDGFDLGVGVLHLLGRTDEERRIGLNAIGPIWDGNEVWLLTAGGALFAAFPPVYATVFSGFYMALVLLLVALMARAVAVEFRSKVQSPFWRRAWDAAFFAGSLAAALLLGVALGNVLRGVPIDADGLYLGTFWGLLNPYALLIGATGLVAMTLHGALFLARKSPDAMRNRLLRLAPALWLAEGALFSASSAATVFGAKHLLGNAATAPLRWGLALAAGTAMLAVGPLVLRKRVGAAFAVSGAAIASMLALAGASLYPRLVPSLTDLGNSLTIYNSSSTPGSLRVMLVVALVGMPVVLAYTVVVHRLFRGKVILNDESY